MDILDVKVMLAVYILVLYVMGITTVRMVVMKKAAVGNNCMIKVYISLLSQLELRSKVNFIFLLFVSTWCYVDFCVLFSFF